MKSVQDALYNWLSIKVVADARVEDISARDTTNLFKDILTEEHGISDLRVEKDDQLYWVYYKQSDEEKKARFPVELIDIMINQMEDEPEKFRNYPSID